MEIKRPEHEDELDAKLIQLFRSVKPAEPSSGFVARTMKAVQVEPLPAGRRPLRHAWSAPLRWAGWATLVGAAAAITYIAFFTESIGVQMFASIIGVTLDTGAQMVRYVAAGIVLSEQFTTVGYAVARAAATREGTMSLISIAAVAGSSLLGLQRLLFSQGEDSQWQELS